MESQPSSTIVSLLAEDRRLISYRPSLNKLTGSVTATILLQQILYWWDKKQGKPFYKFKEPCMGRKEYGEGDSWCEELYFTRAEFDTALSKIAVKRHHGQSVEELMQQSRAFVIYWTDMDRLTYYFVNEELIAKTLREHNVKRESSDTYSENPAIRKEEIPLYIKRESHFRYSGNPAIDNRKTETTTETNTETTTENLSLSVPSSDSTVKPPKEKPKRSRPKKTEYTKEQIDACIQAFAEANNYDPDEMARQRWVYGQVTKFMDAKYTPEDMRGCVRFMRDYNPSWWAKKAMQIHNVQVEMPCYKRELASGRYIPGQKGNSNGRANPNRRDSETGDYESAVAELRELERIQAAKAR